MFDIYVWASPRELDADAAGELVAAWEAAGGDPTRAPFDPSTDIGWLHRELMKDLRALDVTSDAIPNTSRLPINRLKTIGVEPGFELDFAKAYM